MRWTISRELITIPDAGDGFPMVDLRETVLGPDTPPIDVVPASFTDEDVERVAEALWHQAGFGHYVGEEVYADRPARIHENYEAKARAALSAYLEPTTKGDT